VASLWCSHPLLSAIGIAGMDRLVRFNVLAMLGRAVEMAVDKPAAAQHGPQVEQRN
jgi:hypothetical protein